MFRLAILVAALTLLAVFVGVSSAASGPMADAGLDQSVTVDTVVHLDGTGSNHPDGPLSDYEWRIRTPDGRTIEPDCPDCERSQFTPSTVGRYEVTLTVAGPDGTRSTDSLYVYVEDAGPDVALSGQRNPDPGQPVTYTASAESPDAELEEIAWAVEDEIVAVRSLDGTTDQSELSLAFEDAETHRVQVVVRDTNGRTGYDQLYVQPQSESAGVPDSEPQPEDEECDSVICLDIDSPEMPTATGNEEPNPAPFEVRYVTDGYESRQFAGLTDSGSSYMGMTAEEFGLDDGQNAHWEQGIWEKSIGSAISRGSTILFGQEQKTVRCEIDGSDTIPHECGQNVAELEKSGTTSNVYSSTRSGAYSEYGLSGGERVVGTNPTDLEEDEIAEVTIVIQQEEEGIVDRTVDMAESSVESINNAASGVLGETGDNQETSSSKSSSSSDTRTQETEEGSVSSRTNLLSGGIDQLKSSAQKDTERISLPKSSTSDASDRPDNRSYSSSRSGARFAR